MANTGPLKSLPSFSGLTFCVGVPSLKQLTLWVEEVLPIIYTDKISSFHVMVEMGCVCVCVGGLHRGHNMWNSGRVELRN